MDVPATTDPFVEHSLRTSLFFPSSRLFVAGNPKAAGTSLRWWLLDSHGVDVSDRTAGSLWGESAPWQTVWDARVDLRYTWDRLSDEERQDALTSTDVLSVLPVRHPVTRAFAAWSSKYLTREPYYEERLPEDFTSLPPAVRSTDEIADWFHRFVDELAAHVDHEGWHDVDVHFWPQNRLLARDPAGEVLQLRQEDMADGLAAVQRWLTEHGIHPSAAKRLNENVVPYQQSFVDAAVKTLSEVYGDDFARFDYAPAAPASAPASVDLDWLNDVRGRNGRYAVVHEAALASRRRSAHLEQQLRESRQRVHDLEASTSWRVTRPLRELSQRLGRGD